MVDLCPIQVSRKCFTRIYPRLLKRYRKCEKQEHAFRAAELCMEAQEMAIRVETADSLLISTESKN